MLRRLPWNTHVVSGSCHYQTRMETERARSSPLEEHIPLPMRTRSSIRDDTAHMNPAKHEAQLSKKKYKWSLYWFFAAAYFTSATPHPRMRFVSFSTNRYLRTYMLRCTGPFRIVPDTSLGLPQQGQNHPWKSPAFAIGTGSRRTAVLSISAGAISSAP